MRSRLYAGHEQPENSPPSNSDYIAPLENPDTSCLLQPFPELESLPMISSSVSTSSDWDALFEMSLDNTLVINTEEVSSFDFVEFIN